MNAKKKRTQKPLFRLWATFIGLFLGSLSSCHHPESLFVGDFELSFEEVAAAESALGNSFTTEGVNTLRSHLMRFGLVTAAILHQTLPEESSTAFQEADALAQRIRAGESFLDVFESWSGDNDLPPTPTSVQQPSPAGLGASISAVVANLSNGEWAGPVKTFHGWDLVLLKERFSGPRNRAQVQLYLIQIPVGTAADRLRAQENWDTLPLSGNPDLIQALPLSIRLDRTVQRNK